MLENENNMTEKAKVILETLLDKMGVTASVVLSTESFAEQGEGAGTTIILDIKGEDLGILIGRRGQALASLQYIVRLITTHQTEDWIPIVIDVEGYRRRRNEALRAMAWRLAEQVELKGAPFKLEPMTAYERRIVHFALADHPDVTTGSIGVGEARRVVISPK